MKLYVVSATANDRQENRQEHVGYSYFGSKKLAQAYVREHRDTLECETAQINVRPTKRGILFALNLHGGHPDNG